MNTILQLCAPPVLGAFIGYMTNYVAIKMLFRPLRPWRIFGVRVPMTPGVIPSKRHMLAENIGEMVGAHLLTSKDVGQAIIGKKFQLQLQELINNRIDSLLLKDLGPINTVIPKRFKAYFRASIKVLRLRFIGQMHAYLGSDDFIQTIDSAVKNQLGDFLSRDLQDIFPEENQHHFYELLEKTIHDVLSGPAVKEWIANQVQQKINTVIAEERSLNDLVPREISELILDRMEKEAPALIEKFAKLLEEPAMREKITNTICSAIGNFASSLGPIAAMMSSFINPDSIKEKVSKYLNEKGTEIGKWLSDEAVQREVAKLLRSKTGDFLQTPLASLIKDVNPEKIEKITQDFSSKISDLLAKPSTAKSLTAMLQNVLSSQTQRPLTEIITDLFGQDALQKGQQWTSSEVAAIFRSAKVRQLLDQLIIQMVEKKLLDKPIGPLANLLPKAVQQSFADYVLQQVSDLLVREVPGLVDSLNIKRIVKHKVDSLDLLRLEALLMSIMEEQFKYINLFGALLGFIIGMLNLVLLQL